MGHMLIEINTWLCVVICIVKYVDNKALGKHDYNGSRNISTSFILASGKWQDKKGPERSEKFLIYIRA